MKRSNMTKMEARHIAEFDSKYTLCGEENNPWITAMIDFDYENICPKCIHAISLKDVGTIIKIALIQLENNPMPHNINNAIKLLRNALGE